MFTMTSTPTLTFDELQAAIVAGKFMHLSEAEFVCLLQTILAPPAPAPSLPTPPPQPSTFEYLASTPTTPDSIASAELNPAFKQAVATPQPTAEELIADFYDQFTGYLGTAGTPSPPSPSKAMITPTSLTGFDEVPELSNTPSSAASSPAPASPTSPFLGIKVKIEPETELAARKPLAKSRASKKPYARPAQAEKKRFPLSSKVRADEFTPEELEEIQSRSAHKQLKAATIIRAGKEDTHIQVPVEQSCEGCKRLGYRCLVPRFIDFGLRIEHHLGVCVGCHSNSGDCTFRKRPQRRLEAYKAAYKGQEGLEISGNKGHGVKLSDPSLATTFTRANAKVEWRYGGYP